jgi:putative spermidine/putrescine transport system permease protein
MEDETVTTHTEQGSKRPGRRLNISRVFGYVVMACIILAVLVPLIPIIPWSLSQRWFWPQLIPKEWTLDAWRYMLSPASKVGEAARVGGGIALIATVVSVVIGIPAGRALGLHQFRGKQVVQFLVLAPAIVPGMVSLMGIHVLFIKIGLAGTIAGVVLAHLIGTVPYVTTVLSSVFSNYEPEFEEQARTLGAGPLRTFIHVTFPAILPGVVVAGLFAFIISWGQYITTLLISGGRVITVPLLLFTFAGTRNYPYASALALIFIAPSVLYLVIASKYLSQESAALGGL